MNNVVTVVLGIIGAVWLFALAVMVVFIVINWKFYDKAGKPGWASIIPIYNTIVLLDIIGYKWYYIFLFFLNFVPVVGNALFVIFMISLNFKLAKSFGQSPLFGIGLWLLSPVFRAILVFDKSINYTGPVVNGDIDFNDLF